MVLAGNLLDDGWETTSERITEPEDHMSSNSVKVISQQKESSIDKVVNLVLKKIENKKITPPNKETPRKEKIVKNNEPRGNASPKVSKKEICKFYLQDRCIFGYKCRNLHPPDKKKPNLNIPPWNPNMHPNLNSLYYQNNGTSINSGFDKSPVKQTQSTETNFRGRQVGYWSLPHPIPLHQTRFTYLPEVNISNLNDFPNLSPSH